jgi:AcrR family transcriptional regulator
MSRPADPNAKIALLRAAEAAFAAHGLDGAKVDEIARSAGVSKGAFYLHFASKEEAFLHVMESFLAACARSFDPSDIPADALTTPASTLEFWLTRDLETFEFLWANRATLAMLPSCSGPYGYLLASYRTQAHAAVVRWVDEAKRCGVFRSDVDGPVASMLLFGAYNELAFQLASQAKKPPLRSWLLEAQNTFTRAFGVPTLIAALPHVSRSTKARKG